MNPNNRPETVDLLDTLYDIAGVKRRIPTREELGWDGKTKCPYCPAQYVSLAALDQHVNVTHNGSTP